MACKAKLMIPEDEKYEGKPNALSHARTAITTIKAKQLHEVNGIKFIVGNKLIQFTAQHFCLITGLRFGKLPFIPKATNENCSLKRKYFSSNKPPTLLDLHTAFIECTDDDEALKLGMVYFAIFVLLGTEKHVLIDMRYLKLVEDLEEFEKYPWGAVSYAMTNASLLRAVSPDYQRVKTWAFEVFPALEALHFTVHEDNRHIPRILHWRSNTVARFREEQVKSSLIYYMCFKWRLMCNFSGRLILRSNNLTGLGVMMRTMKKLFNCLGMRAKTKPALLVKKKRRMLRKQQPFPPLLSVCGAKGLLMTLAVEHYFKLEMEELKKFYGGEGHEEVCTAQMNEGGQNEMSPSNELTTPTTVGPNMDAQVAGDGVEAFPGMHPERAEMEATLYGGVEGAEREAEVPADGVEAFPAMDIQGAEREAAVPRYCGRLPGHGSRSR
ncbi:unnamed protein product [Prunus brigantina]